MRKLLSFIYCTLAAILSTSAQEDFVPSYPTGPSVVSPQVAEMVRYDSPTIALGTGTPFVTVPLVDFEDPDFPLDISLTYSFSGFKPLEPDNYTGMGWRLNCGGVIMREY